MIKKENYIYISVLGVIVLSLNFFVGCEDIFQQENGEKEKLAPEIPEPIHEEKGEEPTLTVYLHEEENIEEMNMEEYLKGVVAGEMEPDWDETALSSQSIIARTFTLQKIDEQGGLEVDGEQVHASTDIEEFQAYSKEDITEKVENSVENTRGVVATYDNEYIKAWFHAFAGPRTALASEGLGYEQDPPYINIVDSPAEDIVPEDEREWELELDSEKIKEAAFEAGVEIEDKVETFEIKEEGPSGRTTILGIGDKEVPAPEFRIGVGSEEMRSTFIEEISKEEDEAVFKLSGVGYGHGVGMCQWGANKLAEEGKEAEDIIRYFYEDVEINKVWD